MLRIQFDRPEATYFTTSSTGDFLQGLLFVSTNSAMKMNGIAVSIKGECHTSWSEGSGDDRKDYSGYEKYLNEKMTLVYSENEMTLPPGTHEYPFQCALPPSLPSSFKGNSGHVKYYVKAKIIRTGLKLNVEEKFPFIVVRKLVLNFESGEFKEPYQHTEESEVKCCHCCCCYCCWSIGTISANYTLNRRCFVPGESVFINGQIVNNLSSAMKCKFSLKQRIQFSDGGISSTVDIKEIVNADHYYVEPGQTDVWSNVPLLVPALPPSRLDGCKLIDIKYLVQCYVDVEMSHWTREVEIIIGSVPLGGDARDGFAPPVYGFGIAAQPSAIQFQNSSALFK